MKAILIRACSEWRDAMRLEEVACPSPAAGDVLVKLRAARVDRARAAGCQRR